MFFAKYIIRIKARRRGLLHIFLSSHVIYYFRRWYDVSAWPGSQISQGGWRRGYSYCSLRCSPSSVSRNVPKQPHVLRRLCRGTSDVSLLPRSHVPSIVSRALLYGVESIRSPQRGNFQACSDSFPVFV